MPNRKSKSREPTLEELGIYLDGPFDAESCPDELRELFQLVNDVRYLRFNTFARGQAPKADSIEVRPKIVDAHEYDRLLKRRATEMMVASSDPSRVDDAETEWVSALEPFVFRRFDRHREELSVYHHCYVCRRFYPPNSRPLIHPKSSRIRERDGIEVPDYDLELCQFKDKHFNLPNFTKAREVPFLDDDKATTDSDNDIGEQEGPQVEERASKNKRGVGFERADVTIGLCTYNLSQESWRERKDLLQNDRVNLFDRIFLGKLEDRFGIRDPFKRSRNRTSYDLPAFAFGLWEAKKAAANDNHHTASFQSARKLKTLLRSQRSLYEKASVSAYPLVWHFTSVGSTWTVYGCYFRPVSHQEKSNCIISQLWTGDSGDEAQALQLLYITDIIAIWAEHTYKPWVGTCLSKLRVVMEKGRLSHAHALQRALLEVNRVNFPWLLNEDWNICNVSESTSNIIRPPLAQKLQQEGYLPVPSSHRSSGLCIEAPSERGVLRQSRSQSPPRRRSFHHLSSKPSSGTAAFPASISRIPSRPRSTQPFLTHSVSTWVEQGAYLAPELHNFVWVLDQDPGLSDLVVIRVDREGRILNPLIIFNSDEWKSEEFLRLLRCERPRRDPHVRVGFVFNQNGEHYLRHLVLTKLDLLGPSGVQFCAIVPLERKKYAEQLKRTNRENNVFRYFSNLLDIPILLADADFEYGKWCLCDRPWNEYSPPMILCDNVNCKVGWYHKDCVGLDDDFETMLFWLCPDCKESDPKSIVYSTDNDVSYDETLHAASTARIQRTKTFARVWASHAWPSRKKVLDLFDKLSYMVNIDTTLQHEISRNGDVRKRAPPGSWAVSRTQPKTMIKVRPLGLAPATLI